MVKEDEWLKPKRRPKRQRHKSETKKLLSEQKVSENNPMYGRKHSSRSRFKMAKTKVGRIKIYEPRSLKARFVTEADAEWLIMVEGYLRSLP